jgi:Ca2+-binding RTX toxin-like protein
VATLTAQDSSLSFLTNTLGDFSSRAVAELSSLNSRVDSLFDPLYDALYNGYLVSASSSRAVFETYNPYYGRLTIDGGGLTGNSPTLNRIVFRSNDFYLSMSGSVRADAYGNVSGSISRATLGDDDQSLVYVGSISVTTGATRYSSLTYTLRDAGFSDATTSLTYKGSFVEGYDGLIRGTLTSVLIQHDADGAAGAASPQTLFGVSGISRSVVLDIEGNQPFGFVAAASGDFFSSLLTGADAVSGTSGNDTLNGYGGNDVINGLAGADTMDGGEGDDVYYVDNAGDVVIEATDEGTDLVLASVSHTLDDNVENLTLIGTAIDGTGNELGNTLTGNTQANVLTGLGGNDTLIGGGGLDTLIGGEGDDIYVIDRADEIVTELADEGNDTVRIGYANPGRAAVTVTLHDNVENLEVLGAGLFNLVGNAEANALTGNGSANVIDGGAGADEMTGGLGNDTYVVDDAGDVVIETAVKGSGVDLVRASVDYTLTANVENLTLEGGALEGTGNELGNRLTGNELDNELYGLGGNDVLVGGEGADLLDGGEGIDSMSGGAGDDTYVVDNVRDVVSEGLNAGTDTVRSALSYALGANVENLVLTGTAHLNGTGNALANVITGNSGNNILDGGVGADTLIGGEGDDQYVVDNIGDTITEADGEGTDSVRFTLANASGVALELDLGADYAFVENATLAGAGLINLSGSGADNVLTGNAQANVLRGLEGDDELNGGAGADTLIGGEGDDLYIVDQAGDVVTENPGEGTDTVRVLYGHKAKAAVTLSLQTTYANVENLEVLGAGLFNLVGNAEANALTGNGSANVIDGGAGADEMTGGLGNDTYVVDDAGDVVIETAVKGSGVDLVRASVDYTLTANVENLTLEGGALEGTGNELGNRLTGNELDNELYGLGGNDVLVGGEGADLLDGGEGIDSMSGGAGDDTYVVDNVRDVVSEGLNAGTDTVRSSLSYTLGANVENLVLTGTAHLNGTGNALANVITGNSGNNVLDGGVGADTLIGGEGDDQYVVDNIGDTITEADGEGTDSVRFTLANASGVALELDLGADYAFVENATLAGAGLINLSGSGADNVLTGNAQANVLRGLEGDDELNGGAGADTLIGGEGDDLYIVDQAGDVVTENPGEGTDTVRVLYGHKAKAAVTLSLQTTYANVENLEVLGAGLFNLVGNAEANALTGNGSANVIDGGAGADEMTGGLGNDTYVVDDAGDVVIETAVKGSGVDLVRASVDYTLTANVENLTLEGGALEGTGNELGNRLTGNELDNELYGLGGNDVLVGGEGADLLDGGEGIDSMSGGAGDDTYVVDNVRDVVSEGLNAGTDTVRSSLSYTLGANVENLVLTGTAHLNGTGNALANMITGNSGNNVLSGGLGDDVLLGGAGNDALLGGAGNDWLSGGDGLNTLTGGTGEDVFYFDAAPVPGTLQTIADFSLIDDRIVFDATVFDALGAGFDDTPVALPSELLQVGSGSAAADADVRLIYDTAAGALYYDADGNGAGDAVQIAQFTGKPLLSADHFEVLAS